MKTFKYNDGSLVLESIFSILIISITLIILIQFVQIINKTNIIIENNESDILSTEYFFGFIEKEISSADKIFIFNNKILFFKNENIEENHKYIYYSYKLKDTVIRRLASEEYKEFPYDEVSKIILSGNNEICQYVKRFDYDIDDNRIVVRLELLNNKEYIKYIQLNTEIIDLR